MNILKSILENYPDEELLLMDGLDEAIIGLEDNSMRLIYSQNKIIDCLVDQGMTTEEALEYFDFNIGCAWVGDKTPIICNDTMNYSYDPNHT